jgi:hypothetical protein
MRFGRSEAERRLAEFAAAGGRLFGAVCRSGRRGLRMGDGQAGADRIAIDQGERPI